MRRLELLIEAARAETLNKEYSTSIGIPQEDFVVYANDAQDRAFSEIVKTHAKRFLSQSILTTVASQEAYDLPDDCYQGMIENIEYSHDGNEQNYRRLSRLEFPERFSYASGHPSYYIQRNSEILLNPAPAAAGSSIRVTYVKAPRRLELRKASVSARTFSTPTLSALTLATLTTLDPGNELAKYNYICAVDRNGDQMMAGIEYDSVNTGTGVVTLTGGSFTCETGENITTSHYVVLGENSVNKSDLPSSCERFLIRWMAYRAYKRDGSQLADGVKQDCGEILGDIISGFADNNHDVSSVPILNYDMMDGGDFVL